MKRYKYQNFTIELFDETQNNFDPSGTKNNYEKIYLNKDKDRSYTSSHGVKIFEDEKEISACLAAASGGATGVHETSSLMDGDRLLLCCSDSVFCLSLPGLSLEWKTRADWATCFQIFKLEETYIVHGETSVSRIDKTGKTLWDFSGRDFFGGKDVFEIHSDHIVVGDRDGTIYKLDLDGKLLAATPA